MFNVYLDICEFEEGCTFFKYSIPNMIFGIVYRVVNLVNDSLFLTLKYQLHLGMRS